MIELLPLSIGIGLAVSLLFSEYYGLAPGGMVVPGYIALFLARPLDVLLTLLAGLAAFAIVHALSSVIILYGRRRTVLMILVGYLVGMAFKMLLPDAQGALGRELAVIGFIIPGLIAIWLDRQGLVETFCTLLTVSVIVRLILVFFVGAELLA